MADYQKYNRISRVVSSLSMIGSIYIIQDVLRDPRKRKESIYHHIMIGLSTFDILSSFFLHFLRTWPQPEEHGPFSYGTLATCDAAGFIATIGMVGSPLYHCSLATYFLLVLKYNWTRNRMRDIEKWFHIVPWTVAIITSVTLLATQVYGPFLGGCW